MPRESKVAVEVLPGVPLAHALLNEFAPDRPLTAAEVESATQQFKKKLIERALGVSTSRCRAIGRALLSRSSFPNTHGGYRFTKVLV